MPEYISNKTIEKLKHDLVRDNLLSVEDLSRAEEISGIKGQNLAQTIIEEKLITEEALLKFVQDNLEIPYVNLEDYSLDEKCLEFISAEDAKKYRILPLFKIENSLTIAMADPLDLFVINSLVKCVQCQIEPIICSERLILQMVNKYYFGGEEVVSDGAVLEWNEELSEEAVVNSIIAQAIKEDVSEVIIEDSAVKFRETSGIEDKGSMPVLLAPLVTGYLKKISGIEQTPQVGKFSYQGITCVVATFPTASGERITIKLYKPPKTIGELQLNVDLDRFGIIVITGNQSSFIAYSILNSLDTEKKNIMTLESIIKHELKGITQCELNESVSFNMEKALKFIDFQSPDVIYIEEISPEDLLRLNTRGKLIITEMHESSITEELKKTVTDLIIS